LETAGTTSCLLDLPPAFLSALGWPNIAALVFEKKKKNSMEIERKRMEIEEEEEGALAVARALGAAPASDLTAPPLHELAAWPARGGVVLAAAGAHGHVHVALARPGPRWDVRPIGDLATKGDSAGAVAVSDFLFAASDDDDDDDDDDERTNEPQLLVGDARGGATLFVRGAIFARWDVGAAITCLAAHAADAGGARAAVCGDVHGGLTLLNPLRGAVERRVPLAAAPVAAVASAALGRRGPRCLFAAAGRSVHVLAPALDVRVADLPLPRRVAALAVAGLRSRGSAIPRTRLLLAATSDGALFACDNLLRFVRLASVGESVRRMAAAPLPSGDARVFLCGAFRGLHSVDLRLCGRRDSNLAAGAAAADAVEKGEEEEEEEEEEEGQVKLEEKRKEDAPLLVEVVATVWIPAPGWVHCLAPLADSGAVAYVCDDDPSRIFVHTPATSGES
jgi:hypothetical protein